MTTMSTLIPLEISIRGNQSEAAASTGDVLDLGQSPIIHRHIDNMTTRMSPLLDSAPLSVAVAVLLVFVLSPMILCGNSLILTAVYRFKRLRTPSNYLLASLASSDLGVGLFLPVGMYLEITASNSENISDNLNIGLCLVPYCLIISLCSVSVLVMAAIAVDRFTSLAQPLRYNNLITHSSVERYIAAFWLYALLIGFSPLIYSQCITTSSSIRNCSFGSAVARPVQFFLFCSVYGPSALILLVCYCYIYVVARYHARAIYSVELSLRQHQDGSHCRYGQTLAITVGLFLCLWLPFQTFMLLDIFRGTRFLSDWTSIYLALPIFASSAVNPWVYGYRNSEVRTSVQRVMEELLSRLGFVPSHYGCPDLLTATHVDQAELNSFASHVRLCAVSPNRTTLLLIPSARHDTAEGSTGVTTIKETVVHLELPSEIHANGEKIGM
ncbi:hypothetical protein L9F63_023728 [Diploptera punctata]|uniref:G-protein coupled receptors family 1 profile domain-containing protein n=1 Tax=Diploptera punctata TaxID=6984 RepID=A0AAD7ZJM1_DIPPU|nr:hypothetical protein L9F63_023728 [Diploptera punctata]